MKEKKYGVIDFLIDLLLTSITGGLWLVYLLFKFIRNNTK